MNNRQIAAHAFRAFQESRRRKDVVLAAYHFGLFVAYYRQAMGVIPTLRSVEQYQADLFIMERECGGR